MYDTFLEKETYCAALMAQTSTLRFCMHSEDIWLNLKIDYINL